MGDVVFIALICKYAREVVRGDANGERVTVGCALSGELECFAKAWSSSDGEEEKLCVAML